MEVKGRKPERYVQPHSLVAAWTQILRILFINVQKQLFKQHPVLATKPSTSKRLPAVYLFQASLLFLISWCSFCFWFRFFPRWSLWYSFQRHKCAHDKYKCSLTCNKEINNSITKIQWKLMLCSNRGNIGSWPDRKPRLWQKRKKKKI